MTHHALAATVLAFLAMVGAGAIASLDEAVSFSTAALGLFGLVLGSVVGALTFLFRQLQSARDQEVIDLRSRVEKQATRLDSANEALTTALTTTVAQNRDTLARTKDAIDGMGTVLERLTYSIDKQSEARAREHQIVLEMVQRLAARPLDPQGVLVERRREP